MYPYKVLIKPKQTIYGKFTEVFVWWKIIESNLTYKQTLIYINILNIYLI